MQKCSKCSAEDKGLTNIAIGTEDLYVKISMLLCWKCFRKEFQKHETKNVYIFKREEPKVTVKKINSKK
ncbi:hypothetical protein [Mesoplasma seiffertii]|uniref:hypothetical protein n=1 Tax=Mesoplasma seiffertii TaxID=28224 RepID=UPI00047CF677|nr:hypothetical protein [Mesoplasma seiffertii]